MVQYPRGYVLAKSRRARMWDVSLNSEIDDFAVWQAAAFQLKRHGDDAGKFAARHARRLSRLGDTQGSRAWDRISGAIEILRRETADQ